MKDSVKFEKKLDLCSIDSYVECSELLNFRKLRSRWILFEKSSSSRLENKNQDFWIFDSSS